MLKVKDQNGNIIPGIQKSSTGGIIVEKNSEYEKYLREKEIITRLNKIEKDFDELKYILHTILDKVNQWQI